MVRTNPFGGGGSGGLSDDNQKRKKDRNTSDESETDETIIDPGPGLGRPDDDLTDPSDTESDSRETESNSDSRSDTDETIVDPPSDLGRPEDDLTDAGESKSDSGSSESGSGGSDRDETIVDPGPGLGRPDDDLIMSGDRGNNQTRTQPGGPGQNDDDVILNPGPELGVPRGVETKDRSSPRRDQSDSRDRTATSDPLINPEEEGFIRDQETVTAVANQIESTDPGDLRAVRETDDGYIPLFEKDVLRERVAAENDDIDPNDLEFVRQTEDGVEAELTDSAVRERVREEFASERDFLDPDDVVVEERGDEFQIGVTDEFRNELDAAIDEAAAPDAKPDVDFSEDASFEPAVESSLPDDDFVGRSTLDPVTRSSRDADTPLLDAAGDVEDAIGELPGADQAGDLLRGAGETTVDVSGSAANAVSPVTDPVVEFSRDAQESVNENVVDPAADSIRAPDIIEDQVDAIPGASGAGKLTRGAVSTGGRFATSVTVGLPALGSDTIQGTADAATFAGSEIGSEGLVDGTSEIGQTTLEGAARAEDLAVEAFTESPFETTGRVIGGGAVGLATGSLAGRALGVGGRAARQRIRTAGSTRIDAEDLINDEDVLRRVESGEADFPGAENPQQYLDDAPAAIRDQARQSTPEVIQNQFENVGVEGTTLSKALDVEPDGPGPAGFRTQAGNFESPGAFVGPDLSPRFLRIEDQEAQFSLRPGLPDTGDNPTAVLVRTDVETSDADDLDGFTEEILEREGETTAIAKPPGERNVGEIEAVIPPETSFADIGSGVIRDPLRRAGIGSDFSTEVGGTRVPIRTVADPDDIDTPGAPGIRSFLNDERASSGGGVPGGSRVRRDISRRDGLSDPVDRPIPGPTVTGVASGISRSDSSIRSGGSVGGSNGLSSSLTSSRTLESSIGASGLSTPSFDPFDLPGGSSNSAGSSTAGSPGTTDPISTTGTGSAPIIPDGTGRSALPDFDDDNDEDLFEEGIIGAGTERVRDVPDPYQDFLDERPEDDIL